MDSVGTIRKWRPSKGWGVIDSVDTPGGCWAYWSAIDLGTAPDQLRVGGLEAGQRVQFDWEPAINQDGYTYRAIRIVPVEDD